MDIFKMIFTIIIFIAVLYGAYYASKFMAGFSIGFSKSKYMKIVDRLLLTKDKSIVIVKVGDKNLLVGMTNDGLKLLKELVGTEMIPVDASDEKEQVQNHLSFKDILYKRIKTAGGKESTKVNEDEYFRS